MNAMKINENQFIAKVAERKSNEFVSVTTVTEPSMLKKNNPFWGRVLKVNRQTYMFGAVYRNRVNNQLKREGSAERYKNGRLPFGKWEVPNRIIKHNGKFYVRLNPVKGLSKNTTYLIDGIQATQQEVKELERFFTKKGNNNEVRVIDYQLSNIKKFVMNNEVYSFI